jgi:hypothetical protein
VKYGAVENYDLLKKDFYGKSREWDGAKCGSSGKRALRYPGIIQKW